MSDLKFGNYYRKTLEDIGIGNYFLNRTPIAKKIRARTDKWDCITLKCFHTTEETITIMKRSPTEWEKIFASYSLDKGLTQNIKRAEQIKH
jgi:hypothetical protein